MTDVNNDPFYPHRWTEEDKAAVRNGPLWPLIVAAHYGFGKKLYVSYKSAASNIISMGVLNGVQVLACVFNRGTIEYRIREYIDPISCTISNDLTGSNKPLITSKNINYIIKKFNDPEDEGNKQIIRRIAEAEASILQNVLGSAVKICATRRPTKTSLNCNIDQVELALKVLFGGYVISPNDTKVNFNYGQLYDMYAKLADYDSRYELHMNKTHNFFDRSKWIAIKAGEGTPNWIIGQMKTDFMATEALTPTYKYPKLDSSTMTIPFNLYAGFDYTPFREEFIGALTLCKVAREGKDQPRVSCIDPEGLIPGPGIYYSDETGLLAWSEGSKQCLMFDKLA